MARTYPVIHYLDDAQALRNAEHAADAGCEGVLLIQMEGRNAPLMSSARRVADAFPDMRVGVNLLGHDPGAALMISLDAGLDMTWTDAQLTHSSSASMNVIDSIEAMLAHADGHEFFVGVAFKHQAPEPDPVGAALRAASRGMIPTTSGPSTGTPAEVGAIRSLRAGLGRDVPLAIASGIDPDNAPMFAPHLSHILVATGVSRSFHEFDRDRLRALVERVRACD